MNLIPYIYKNLIIFILAFSRISSLFSVFVLFRRDFINMRIMVTLAGILSLYIVFLIPKQQVVVEVVSIRMLILVFFEVFIGFIAGLILNITFEVFVAFGQLISTQIGFSMVTLIDPRLGAITPLTLFYTYVTMLIFLQLNGHLLIIQLILDSFHALPVMTYFFPKDLMMQVLNYSQVIFTGGVFLSITVIITVLIINLTLAVMAKFAPQFNLFSIGMSISIIIGLFCIYITFGLFVSNGTNVINEGLEFLNNTITRLK